MSNFNLIQKFIQYKLYLFVLSGAVLIYAIWYNQPSDKVTHSVLLNRIRAGYPDQFCQVIFPRIANCVSLAQPNCKSIASAQLEPCINKMQDNIPSSTSAENAKKIYDSLSKCFADNMHQTLLQNYYVDKPECAQIMS